MDFKEFLKDPWNYIGSIGATMIVAIEWIATHLSPIIGLFAGIGGLIVVVIGIRIQMEKLRHSRKDNDLKDLEIENEKEEIDHWRRNQ